MRIRRVLFVLGLGLMAINLIGIFKSLRNPAIYSEPGGPYHPPVSLSPEEIVREQDRRPGEDSEAYVRRLTEIIHLGVLHYWSDEGITEYGLRVPFWENYLLNLGALVRPEVFQKYEFSDHAKAAERGVGFCSQQSIIMAGILDENGIKANIVGLDGHVVVAAEVGADRWYVVDPDFGVVIPHSVAEIEENPELVRAYYRNIEDSKVTKIVGVYGFKGNETTKNGVLGYVGRKKYYLEKLSYVGIWLIPLGLCLPYAMAILRRRVSRKP